MDKLNLPVSDSAYFSIGSKVAVGDTVLYVVGKQTRQLTLRAKLGWWLMVKLRCQRATQQVRAWLRRCVGSERQWNA